MKTDFQLSIESPFKHSATIWLYGILWLNKRFTFSLLLSSIIIPEYILLSQRTCCILSNIPLFFEVWLSAIKSPTFGFLIIIIFLLLLINVLIVLNKVEVILTGSIMGIILSLNLSFSINSLNASNSYCLPLK